MSQEPSEVDWVGRAIGGDRAALSQLLLTHYDALRGHIARRIPAELQGLVRAEDVLHQTFVRAAQSLDGFQVRPEGSFRAWLQTIAENLLKDAAKRRRRERRSPDARRPGTGSDDSSVAGLVERLAHDSSTPVGHAQRQENIRRVLAALAALPDEQRAVLERHYLQDQPLDEIAAALGRTKDAIRGICYRARRNLRDIMGRSSLYFSG
jgi:RNA polymerase sigma-70 factor (ECF subfamily)